jgi:hypothetical protein
MIKKAGPLAAGLVAGPLLLLILLIDGATRPGYDQVRHGVSQLGTGDRGWLVQASFVGCGVLFAVLAVGVHRRLRHASPRSAWLPRWLGVLALGLVLAGVAPTDPALGFPPGAPAPAAMSPAAGVHQVGGALVFIGLIGAGIVAGRWSARAGDRRWARYSIGTAIAVTGTALAAGVVYRLIQRGVVDTGPAGLLELIAFILGFGWTAAFSAALIRRPPRPAVTE